MISKHLQYIKCIKKKLLKEISYKAFNFLIKLVYHNEIYRTVSIVFSCIHYKEMKSHPNPNMNTDRFIRKLVCAKDRLAEAHNIMPVETAIDFLRPAVSDIEPNRNAPTAIPMR